MLIHGENITNSIESCGGKFNIIMIALFRRSIWNTLRCARLRREPKEPVTRSTSISEPSIATIVKNDEKETTDKPGAQEPENVV